MDLSFRRAGEADLPAIVDLLAADGLGRNRERPGPPPDPAYLEAFRRMERHPGNFYLLACTGDEVVGCLQLTFIDGLSRLGARRAQIEGVRVHPNQRGSGIGEALFREAIEQAKRAGCSLVQLTTDKQRGDAHRFYERFGFEASHLGMKLKLG
jgi:ribosomal protein S18 acetylase RimI-like enzyme